MKTRRHRGLRRRRTRKHNGGKKSGKKWVTAIDAAKKTLSKTGDINAAQQSLRKQALTNARKLFGSLSS
jgi:hypothetical protein